jgi:hypothetical protein
VSESTQPASLQDAPIDADVGEAIDALPVLVGEAHPLRAQPSPGALPERRSSSVLPAVQAAAVAAGGFVAGAAVVGLVHRRQRRASALAKARPSSGIAKGRRASGLAKGRGARRIGAASRSRAGRRSSAPEPLQIVGTRTLLVDVHLLGGPGER